MSVPAPTHTRWKDYSEDDDTEEPWDNVKSNVKFHEYLQQLHAEALIPASFKQGDP